MRKGKLLIVTNEVTGEQHSIDPATLDLNEAEAMMDESGTDLCVGGCECSIEPDGVCNAGWPSRLRAAGII